MPDQITEVTTRSWGSRLGNSFGAILGSLLIFIGSFVLLYWNEGRVDLSTIAKTAVEAPVDRIEPALDNKLISVTGQVKTTDMISDKLFLAPGNYLGVMRTVEMYAWDEKTSSTSETKVGGSEQVKTTYTYDKRWTANPSESSSFKERAGHENPVMRYEGGTTHAEKATIGAYTIYPSKMAALPEFTTLSLTKEMVPTLNTPTGSGAVMGTGATMTGTGTTLEDISATPRLIDGGLYIGKGDRTAPQIGDLFVTYRVLMPDLRATVFGRQVSTSIENYATENASLYGMYAGNREEAVKGMHDAFVTMTWVLRVVGFLMMWAGLSGIFAPLHVLLDVLPFLGQLSRSALGFITFFVALILSVLTIIVSMILHNIFLVILLAIGGIAAVFFWLRAKGGKQ